MNGFFVCVSSLLVASIVSASVLSTDWEWNTGSPEAIAARANEIAAAGVDGVCYFLWANDADGRTVTSRGVMHEPVWRDGLFASQLSALRAMTAKPGLRESYLAFFRSPDRRFDWRDDAAWAIASNNLAVTARIARKSGFVGLRADHEDYKLVRQFQRLKDDPPMEELRNLVRRRARETFGGAFAEFPAAKVSFSWFLSSSRGFFLAEDARRAAEDAGDLWPAFVDGILDVLPSQAVIYDGDETAYEYRAEDFEYLIGADSVRRGGIRLVSAENREKYVRQVRYAPGIYVEMHCQTNAATKWYRAPWNGSKGNAFRRDFARAFEAADDGLVWIFSEKHPIVDWGAKGCPNGGVGKVRVQDVLDGFGPSIRAIKDPAAFLRDDFIASLSSNVLGKIGSWFERDVGKFRMEATGGLTGGTAYVLENALNGCLTCGASAVPGEIYVIRASAKRSGGGFSATVRFNRGRKMRFFVPAKALSFGAPDANGWCMAEGVVVIPEGVDSFTLLLGAKQEKGESCRFSDIGIWRAF